MRRKAPGKPAKRAPKRKSRRKRSALVDTRVIYCGDNLEQLKHLPDGCVDLIYIDPPFNSNRNYEVFWGETREKRAFADRHASTEASFGYSKDALVEIDRFFRKTGGMILPLTVKDILEEQLARKLA